MKTKIYWVTLREASLQPREEQGNFKSRGLHRAFNKGGIQLRVTSQLSIVFTQTKHKRQMKTNIVSMKLKGMGLISERINFIPEKNRVI